MRRVGLLLGVLILGSAVLFGAYVVGSYRSILGWAELPGNHQDSVRFLVVQGTPPRSLARRLHEAGLVDDPLQLYRLVRYIEPELGRVRSGAYVILPEATPREILVQLCQGPPPSGDQ